MGDRILRVLQSMEVPEGEGAVVRRLFPTRSLEYHDPFVLFDEFFVEGGAGFPDHPHRGFEVVTYMLEGGIMHRDSAGNEGMVDEGGAQRITVGRGIVHSEFPASSKASHGIQLWVNLPRRLKDLEPDYQQVGAARMPGLGLKEVRMKVVVGNGSPMTLKTDVGYNDVEMAAGSSYDHAVPWAKNALLYVIAGDLRAGGTEIGPHEGALLKPGGSIRLEAQVACRLLLLTGRPHREPVIFRGSFVD